MKTLKTTSILLISATVGLAQAQKNQAPAASAPKKTVGELLKQADRGAGVQLQQKKDMTLPQFNPEVLPTKARPATDLNKVKPPRTSTFLENANTDQAKLEAITDQQIRELFKLTQKFKSSPQRGELWLRLAELYVEKSSVIEFRKQTEYDQKLKDFQGGKTKVKPALNLNDAKEYNRKAMQLYEWFVRDFPKDPKLDQALFFLGYNNYEIGDIKKGTAFYEQLSADHPNSPFVTEANFALGEYYFENENWKKAHQYYAQVLKRPRHRLYSFSLYKTSWCYFRTGDPASALKTMEVLIRGGKQANADSESGRKNFNKSRLETEGMRDVVLFYAEVGAAEKAPSYFQGLAGNDANNYIEKLAYYYGDKGYIEQARTLFRYLISQNPNASKAFDYKYQIVQLYSNQKKTREFREELYSWIRDFGTGSSWYQANKDNKELIDNSFKLRETTLRNYTLQQHQTAQNSRAPYSQSLALEGYRLYLAEFTQAPLLADMHFYFGELLYDMNKFEEASTQYRWVVENGASSKYASKAAENIILALERGVPKDSEISARVGKSLEPVQFDARVDKFVSASNWYLTKFPNTEKAAEVKFRVGRLYYQHNQFEQAIPHFREIIQKYPTTKYAEFSANLLLDIYSLRKDYEGLSKTGAELLAVPSIANSKAGEDIRGVMEKANFKRAQDLEGAKDYKGSAEQFEAFAKQNPRSPLALTATFNSAINYERAGVNASAIAAHRSVLASPSKEAQPFKEKSRRIIGKLYQDSGMLEEAAAAYKSSAAELGKDPLVPNLYFNAGILNEALGRNPEAIRNYETSYENNKKSDKVEALFQMATLMRKQGQSTKAIEKYKAYIETGGPSKEKVVESAYYIYELSVGLRRVTEGEEWRKKTLAIQRRYAPGKKGVGATYAAKLKFKETQEAFDKFRGIRIPADPKKQQAAVQEKISLLTDLNKQLTDVVQYDSPEEIIGALSVLGQANLHMGEALVNTPVPAGLNAEETKQYRAGVDKLAEPFFNKAKESLKVAVTRASELDVFNMHYAKARELVLKLDPQFAYDGGELTMEARQGAWLQ